LEDQIMTHAHEGSGNGSNRSIASAGDFADVSFPKLLLDLCRARYSGALDLTRGKTSKRIVFQQGAPVLSESNLASETLGMQLMDQESLTRLDLERVSAYMEREQCKEGVALLALKFLEPKELFLALKEQMRRRILETFAWSGGAYRLESVDDLEREVQPLRSDPLALVMEGLLNHWTPDQLLGDLTDKIERFPQRTKAYDEVQRRLCHRKEISSLMDRIDGNTTLGAAIGSQFNSAETLAAIWMLTQGRYVRYSETALLEQTESEDEPRETEIEIEVVRPTQVSADRLRNPASPSPASQSTGAENGNPAEAMRADVLKRLEEFEDSSFYALLGVSETATDGEIRKAYFAAAKRFHPDALTQLGLSDIDIKEQAAAVFARIAEANDVLRDSKRRAEYDARDQNSDESAIDTHALAQAETFYRKSEILVRMGDFRGALEYLEPAVELWPDECEYQSALGWALYKQPHAEKERSLVHLERARSLDPSSAVTQFRLGTVLRACGEDRRAAAHLATAKQLDPTLV
jgi:tetratricopeptide (TPR) repeat protein